MPRKAKGADGASAPSLINQELHRFPWPADPSARYSARTPWLAVVNARGPWGVWKHFRTDPQWLPLYHSLLDKPIWSLLDDTERWFMIEIWRRMAAEDWWGIIWGDPVRICLTWGCDVDRFNAVYSVMLQHGFLVYLTNAEKLQVESSPKGCSGGKGERGRERGGTIGGYEGGREEIGGQQIPDSRQGTEDRGDRRDRRQATASGNPSAQSLFQVQSDSGGQQTADRGTGDSETGDTRQKTADSSTGDKPANLTKSDRRAGKTTSSSRRPGSVPQPVGSLLYWSDPRALEFARSMYGAVTGGRCPVNIEFASREDKSIVGVWAKAWCERFACGVKPHDFKEFCERCSRDIAKKRGRLGVKNLGGLAMDKIVPGIVAAMGGH